MTGAQMRPIRSRRVGATYFGSLASISTSGVAGSWVAAAVGLTPTPGGGSGVADQTAGLESRPHRRIRLNNRVSPGGRDCATSGVLTATGAVYACYGHGRQWFLHFVT